MKRKMITILMAIMMLIVMTACGKNDNSNETKTETSIQSSESESESAPASEEETDTENTNTEEKDVSQDASDAAENSKDESEEPDDDENEEFVFDINAIDWNREVYISDGGIHITMNSLFENVKTAISLGMTLEEYSMSENISEWIVSAEPMNEKIKNDPEAVALVDYMMSASEEELEAAEEILINSITK